MAPNDLGGYGARDFYTVLTQAVADLSEHGFDSSERLNFWLQRIREAAQRSLTPEHMLQRTLDQALRSIYQSKVERGAILKLHEGVSRFTLEKVRPQLRAELDRRLMASANLIRLNREQAVEKTLQRFSGWATSIPAGGSDAVRKTEEKTRIRKSLASLPFEERRVLIDQSAKMVANINQLIALDGGAIAAEWLSRWRVPGYHFRPDHKERDEKIYAIRGSWAMERGLMKLDGHQYLDEITQPAEEPFCRCSARYLYSLRSLPPGMLTEKGRAELARVKVA